VGGRLTGIVDNCLSGSINEVLTDPRDNLIRQQLPLVTAEYCCLEIQIMSTLPAALQSVVRVPLLLQSCAKVCLIRHFTSFYTLYHIKMSFTSISVGKMNRRDEWKGLGRARICSV
jgi:hypothetical protein